MFKGSSITILGRYNNSGKADILLKGKMNNKIHALEYEKMIEGPDSGGVFLNVAKLAEAHEALGQFDAAIGDWRDYMDYLKGSSCADDRYLARAKKRLGDLYLKLDRRKNAIDMFAEALAIYNNVLADDDIWNAMALESLGLALMRVEQYEGALKNLDKALRIKRQTYSEISPKTAQTLMHLARCFDVLGQDADAKGAAAESLRLLQSYPWAKADDLEAAQSLVELLGQ